jgi:hypothetical protein
LRLWWPEQEKISSNDSAHQCKAITIPIARQFIFMSPKHSNRHWFSMGGPSTVSVGAGGQTASIAVFVFDLGRAGQSASDGSKVEGGKLTNTCRQSAD